jgi:hypothetical protein
MRVRLDPSTNRVIPVLVTGIHLAACAGAGGWLDPGNKCRDDNRIAASVP